MVVEDEPRFWITLEDELHSGHLITSQTDENVTKVKIFIWLVWYLKLFMMNKHWSIRVFNLKNKKLVLFLSIQKINLITFSYTLHEQDFGKKIFLLTPYFFDMSPYDYFLFPKIKL